MYKRTLYASENIFRIASKIPIANYKSSGDRKDKFHLFQTKELDNADVFLPIFLKLFLSLRHFFDLFPKEIGRWNIVCES